MTAQWAVRVHLVIANEAWQSNPKQQAATLDRFAPRKGSQRVIASEAWQSIHTASIILGAFQTNVKLRLGKLIYQW
jgi:hypothetical protein